MRSLNVQTSFSLKIIKNWMEKCEEHFLELMNIRSNRIHSLKRPRSKGALFSVVNCFGSFKKTFYKTSQISKLYSVRVCLN